MEVLESERVTREQAIEMMTSGAAFAEFAEADKGRLAVGALADLVVLMSPDVFTAPADRLPGIYSLLTVIGGHPVYPAGPWPQ